MPLVTVVVPNFNYGRFLERRLESILSQTVDDIEVIVVDDASTDGSRDVIERFVHDPRVRTLFFDTNSQSIYQRWNDGAATARGRYLWFAGADDYSALSFLEKTVSVLESNSSVGIAFSQSSIVDQNGRAFAVVPEKRAGGITPGDEECRAMMLDMTIPTASATVLRTQAFVGAGGFDRRFRYAADWTLYMAILRTMNVAYVAEPLTYYRMHTGTASIVARRSGDETVERYRAIEHLVKLYPELEPLRDAALQREAERSLFLALNALRRGSVAASARIFLAGSRVDGDHFQRIVGAAPQVGRTVASKLYSIFPSRSISSS